MPELPDVEQFARHLEKTVLNRKITAVTVLHTKVLENITPERLQQELHGLSFTSLFRHGKYLFLYTNRAEKLVLMLHFGMSGYPQYLERGEQL